MNIISAARRRYACKAFKPNTSLSAAQIADLKEVLRLSPCSINLQARHFILATSSDAKSKIAAACTGEFAYNASKINDSALVIIFCANRELDASFVERVISKEQQDGRFADAQALNARRELLNNYVATYSQDPQAMRAWLDKQSYIALGQVLLAAAAMGIDSVPIEGFDHNIIAQNFALLDQNLCATALAAFGTHSDADFNYKLSKSRLDDALIFSQFE